MVDIPDDILSKHLFINLPSKKLAQMRSLSKYWNAYLSKPSFIKSHLHHSTHKKDETLLVFRRDFTFNNKPFTVLHSESPHLQLTDFQLHDFIKFPLNTTPSRTASCKIIGSVHGLICFLYKSSPTRVIYIWNPSLSLFTPLPSYTVPSLGLKTFFRFGFDPTSDDYKVVKLTGVERPLNYAFPTRSGGYHYVVEWSAVEVYSMRKGFWEIFNQSFPSDIKGVFDKNEVFVDGIGGNVHWLGMGGKQFQQTIVGFDLSVQTFHEISLPDFTQDLEVHQNALGVLDGKLCVLSCSIRGGECDLWVMNEYRVAESWVKRCVFSNDCGISVPFGLTSNQELLYLPDSDHLALYDPTTTKVKSFEINIQRLEKTKTVQYVESLVWIAPVA